MNLKKVLIPIIGSDLDFHPLNKVIAKEFLPLGDRPLIDYFIEEAKDSGFDQINLIFSEEKKNLADYFKKNKTKKSEKISSSFQLDSKGIGQTVFKAKSQIKKDPFALLLPNKIIQSKRPALSQLKKIFKTSQKPVLGFERNDFFSKALETEKIARRLYKIKRIKENFFDKVSAGRFILTPEIFNYLKKDSSHDLLKILNLMIGDGKVIYGYELEGSFLEINTKRSWLKNNLLFSLNYLEQDSELKKIFKKKI